jgi:putative NADPH-quinone reductase
LCARPVLRNPAASKREPRPSVPKRILIIQGHPDPAGGHFCHALADAYAAGARAGGHEVQIVPVATLDFPLLRSLAEFERGPVPPALRLCQEMIGNADHLVIVYPLWLGTMPALLKGFLEQVFRPDFAFKKTQPGRMWLKGLTGKSARIVVTMGMPAFVYRWYFGAHSLKSLERNILRFAGIKPIRESLVGMVEGISPAKRQSWLEVLQELGAAAR